MADPDSLLDQFSPDKAQKKQPVAPTVAPQPDTAPKPAPEQDNAEGSLVGQFNPFPDEKIATPDVSKTGTLARSAARSAVPALTGIAGAAAGAEVGAAGGALVGAAFPPALPFTTAGGAIIGGIAGMFGASWATEKAQDWGIKQLPDSWQENIGQSDRQQKLDEMVNPKTAFIGGLLPYAMTMRPGGFARKAVPENATAFERIMANPVTARVFGGAAMGGFELGQEAVQGDVDWAKVGIATGFGVVFNKPTKFGERISNVGAAPMRGLREGIEGGIAERAGRRAVEKAGGEYSYDDVPSFGVPRDFTLAQTNDIGVMGPGATEETFFGSHSRNPDATATAREGAQAEATYFGHDGAAPDLHTLARQAHPEVFAQQEDLLKRQETFRRWLDELGATREQNSQPAIAAQQAKIDAILERVKGVEERLTKKQAADLAAARAEIEAAKAPSGDTADMAIVRKRLTETREKLWDLAPDVRAAYRRTAERHGIEMVESEAAPPVSPETPVGDPRAAGGPEPAPVAPGETPPPDAAVAPVAAPVRPITEQKANIAADVTRQALEAGRPKDEADALGKIAAAHYEARADLSNGALGTAEELYRREGAEIQKPPAALAPDGVQGSLSRDLKPVLTIFQSANASTALHEFGHQFLDQLIRDAQHEKATPEVKRLADAAKKWLGTKGEAPTVAQQERFARTWERYWREGVAPSRELMDVFAKFEAWLKKIYETVKGLGRPITPDIREVFDRMLSAKEDRAMVIGGEYEYGPSIDHIHAADAAEIKTAHEAGPAADRIAAEKQHVVETLPTEVRNELETKASEVEATEAAKPGGEAGAGPGGPREVEQGGGAAGSEPGGSTGGGESRAVVSGGSEAASDGATAGTTEHGSGARSDAHPLAPASATSFAGKPSFNIGKDGNVRNENITSIPQFMQALDEASENVAGAGGPVTMGMMIDLADETGIKASKLTEQKLVAVFGGVKDLASKIWAFRVAIQKQSEVVHGLMQTVRDSGSDASVMEYAKERERFHMMYSVLSSVTSEMGRGLGMGFRNLEGWGKVQDTAEFLEAHTGRTLYQLRMEAKLGSQMDTPRKMARFMSDVQKRSYGRMALEYFVNNLISGLATHSTYIAANGVLATQHALVETPVAGVIGAVREALGREGPRVYVGEGLRMGAAAFRNIPAALQATIEAGRTGTTTRLPGEAARPMTPFDSPFSDYEPMVLGKMSTNDRVTWHEAVGDLYGLGRGLLDGMSAAGELLKAGGVKGAPIIGATYSPLGQIPDLSFRGVRILPGILPGGTQARLPSRMVAMIHSFWRSTGYAMEKAGFSYRTAVAEGLTGNDRAARMAEIQQNPSEEQMDRFRVKATENALMGKGGDFTQYLSKIMDTTVNLPILGETAPLKFINPFVKVSSNIINQAIIQRTPAGLLSGEVRADLMGHNGTVAQDMASARMLVGTAYALGFGTLAGYGYISGSGPTDRNKAAMWRMAGNQPHSVKINNTWYDLHRLGPMGMLMGVAADMHDVAHLASEGEMVSAATALAHAISQNVLDESFMRGPSDLIRAVEDSGRYGDAYLRAQISSFLPFSVGSAQMARAMDPYSRQARTIVDGLKAKIPGMSEELMPRIDIWGQPLPNREVFGVPGFSAIYETKVSTDPVNIAMVKLGMGPSPVQRKIRGVELTDEQYDQYARYAGRMAKIRLDVIVNSPDFQRWPTHSQHDVIQETMRQSREIARAAIMTRWPDIIRKANVLKMQGHKEESPE